MEKVAIFWFFLILIIALIIYFLPSFIAFRRQKKNAIAIFILNLFLGVTFIGWVAALIWAVMHEEKNSQNIDQNNFKDGRQLSDTHPN